MSEILIIDDEKVIIGNDDGTVSEFSKTSLNYNSAKVGDIVKVFSSETRTIISKNQDEHEHHQNHSEAQVVVNNVNTVETGTSMNNVNIAHSARVNRINKHVFVWLGTLIFGYLGVDRFMRGQIGLGIFKIILLLFGWIPLGLGWFALGIWDTVDWIIGLIKAYSTYNDTEDITFVNGRYSR